MQSKKYFVIAIINVQKCNYFSLRRHSQNADKVITARICGQWLSLYCKNLRCCVDIFCAARYTF